MKSAKISLLIKLPCLIITLLPSLTRAQVAPLNEYPIHYQDPSGWRFETQNLVPLDDNSLFTTRALNEIKNEDDTIDTQPLTQFFNTQIAVSPSGAPTDPLPAYCRGQYIEDQIKNANGRLTQIAETLQNYFTLCEKVLTRNNDRTFFSLLRVELIKYQLAELEGATSFRLQIPNGSILHGQILRKDNMPRPWVIIKCGVFCEAKNDSRTKNIIMHLFDEGPFNLLLLDNNMTAANIIANNRVNVNGYYEGQELIHAAYWLKYISPFSEQVTAIHGMGISLGGSSSLFAALYNDHNAVKNEKLLNSVIAYCPVVNTYPTYVDIFQNNLRGKLFSHLTWQTIQDVYPHLEDVQRLIRRNKKPNTKDFPRLLSLLGWNFISSRTLNEFIAPFRLEKPMSDWSQMWSMNNFAQLAPGLQTPTLVLASKDDWVVNYNINAGSLKNRFQQDPNTNLRVVDISYGNHCSKSLTYGWQSVSRILRGYYLSMTPQEAQHKEQLLSTIKLPKLFLKSGDLIADYQWTASHQSDHAEILFKVWNTVDAPKGCITGTLSRGRRTYNYDPYASDRNCYKLQKVRLPYSQLQSLGLRKPRYKTQAESFTRYLNSHVELLDKGQPIYGSHQTPSEIRLTRYVFE